MLLLDLQLQIGRLTRGQFQVILRHLKLGLRLTKGLTLGVQLNQDLLSVLVERSELGVLFVELFELLLGGLGLACELVA